ncbi:energy-coupling factor transporter transmembrane component T family protein [Halosegnis marinus]|uniref:Energy-coupling factor transporter transmembrane component T family protein n=1 Tax=Halosegnis marinus TaxID=3034023 RepID=A0ABD5ZNV8_9EURY|nr:energy-coupling factor transporter transmembrane component T [Halosegnis sp. DT85]
MSFRYEPGDTLAHRLDPRTKLFVQLSVAVAAFAHTTPRGLAALTGLAAVLLYLARTSPVAALAEVWVALPLLVAGPLLEGITLAPVGFSVAQARFPALASYRTLVLLVVAAAYVRTTPVRESRAAVQRTVPGKPGQLLGLGIGFVFRFLPLLRDDLSRIRDASRARLGENRPVRERMRLVTVAGLNRAFRRADTFALALRARCLSWNPTLPELRLRRRDLPALALGVALLVAALL